MKTSPEVKNIIKAIQQVQQTVAPLKREATGSTGQREYKYATLDKVWEQAQQAIKDNDLAIIQSPTAHGEGNAYGDFFQTTIYHVASGEWVQETANMKTSKDDPQGYGSAITYYRRYMLVSMLGLIVQGDDNDASDHKLATSAQKAKIIGAVKQIFPDLTTDQQIITTVQNIAGKHPSYIREDEADGVVQLIQAFTAKAVEE